MQQLKSKAFITTQFLGIRTKTLSQGPSRGYRQWSAYSPPLSTCSREVTSKLSSGQASDSCHMGLHTGPLTTWQLAFHGEEGRSESPKAAIAVPQSLISEGTDHDPSNTILVSQTRSATCERGLARMWMPAGTEPWGHPGGWVTSLPVGQPMREVWRTKT